ncbi:hypothetical protein [Fictibacillus gelatini]|uniref:hypothetical protein n=1 Tax=Fictibacillus gelatini TaxID=225985 RepID=UPI0004247872|nr:hypothetical protein [Fictibacillus gelatini]
MNRAEEIVKEIKDLHVKLEQMKNELKQLQESCEHQFIEEPFMRTCTKCCYIEGTHY